MVRQRAQAVHDIVERPVRRGALVEIVVQGLTPQMEEVVEIVGAQICCAALGDVHVLRRSVRLSFERIKSATLGVLQRHIDPVEQLCRLVHRGTSLYSGHHVAFWRRTAPLGTAPSEPPCFLDHTTSLSHPPAPTGWV